MDSIVWAVVGFVAGLAVMGLALRFLAIQPQKTQTQNSAQSGDQPGA